MSLNFSSLDKFKKPSTTPSTRIGLTVSSRYDDEEPLYRPGLEQDNKDRYKKQDKSLTHQETEDLIKKTIIETPHKSGIESSRIITSEILMKAPEDFFDKYNEISQEIVEEVRRQLAEDPRVSELIQAGNQDPTNTEIVSKAYNVVYNNATAELNNTKKILNSTDKKILMSLIVNEILGFSRLDPLWQDDTIDEISCAGPYDITVQIRGKWMRVPACNFVDREHLESLIERLYAGLNKTVSKTNPAVNGRLHDNSRLHTTHTSMSPDGPNFSIRRHREDYIPPAQLITWGTANEEILTFLGNLLYKGCSALVIGGTGTGKTTALAALSGFYRNDHRIVTLEDNIELKIAPHKMRAAAMQCIEPRPDVPGSGVDMRRLVFESLRMSPKIIIVGEVRGSEAFDLVQALNTGHYGMSTVHANGAEHSVNRLSTMLKQDGLIQGDGALSLIGSAFDVVISVDMYSDGSRKISNISEFAKLPERRESGEMYLPLRPLYVFEAEPTSAENPIVKGEWVKKNDVSEELRSSRRLDLVPDLTWEELKKLSEGN